MFMFIGYLLRRVASGKGIEKIWKGICYMYNICGYLWVVELRGF